MCSAGSMNACGGSSPRSGWRQRTSASTARTRPSASATCGWNSSTRSPCADRAAELGDEREPLRPPLVERAVVDEPVAVRRLRAVQRDVGVPQQRVDARAVVRVAGDPDRGADLEVDAAHGDRLAQRGDDLARDGLAAVACRRRARARARTRRRRGGATRSPGRTRSARRRPTSVSTMSPRRWPSVSLSSLKRVSPTISTPTCSSRRVARCNASSTRAREVLAVRQAGDAVVARLVLVDHRLAAAELDRHQRDPEQREQPQVVVRGDEDHRDERGQHHGPPGVEPEVGAHRLQRARRRAASAGGVLASAVLSDEERDGARDQRRRPLQLEVLEAVLVGQVAA